MAVAQRALERLGVAHLAERPLSRLSGGEQQLVLLARALAQEAPLLVLDEPTASLDYGNQVRFLGLLRELAEEGRTVVMTSHVPEHAFLSCNRVALLKDGRLLAVGVPHDVVTEGNLSILYEVRVRVVALAQEGTTSDLRACIPLPG